MSTFSFWSKKAAQLALGLVVAAAVAACGGSSSGEKPRASVQFSLGSADSKLASALAAAAPANPPAAVVVTIEDTAGRRVHDLLRLDVYAFGPSYVSQQLELDIGHYRLTQFLVVDQLNETIYAAPVDPWSDPELLARVSKPLPIDFEVVYGVLHGQPVEVLPVVEGQTPQQFGYTAFTFRTGGAYPKSVTRVHYGRGFDDMLRTVDDEVVSYNHLELFEDGYTLTDRWFSIGTTPDGRGPDMTWFTPDDAPLGWWWEQGKGEYGTHHDLGAGPDGIRVSTDDPISRWEKYDLVVQGDFRINGIFTEQGPDGLWFTADDVLGGYLKMQFNANGAETMRIRYVSPGPDGAWFTPDDELGEDWFGVYAVNRYPGTNNRWESWDRQVRYVDAGMDGEWFTPDDVPQLCLTHEFADGSQYWTGQDLSWVGDDGACFTDDDQLLQYSIGTNKY